VGEVLRPRLGDEVVERLVQPLLGGVHAGSVDRLSARSTVPEVLAIAASQRSLMLALRGRRRSAPRPTAPPVRTVLMANAARTFLNLGIEFPPWKDGCPLLDILRKMPSIALKGLSPHCGDFLASLGINGDSALLRSTYLLIGRTGSLMFALS
jgi:hypothetical protein